MAKKGKVESNKKRARLIEKYRAKREELRKRANDVSLSDSERDEARRKLNALPRNSSPTRYRNRCGLTGRPRSYLRKFGLSRIAFRDLASNGMIPGVTKSSW